MNTGLILLVATRKHVARCVDMMGRRAAGGGGHALITPSRVTGAKHVVTTGPGTI